MDRRDPLKALHKAKNFEDLMTDLPDLKKYKVRDLALKAGQIFDEYHRQMRTGDEEQAYIMCHRYIGTVLFIHKSADYKADPKYYNSMISRDKVTTAINHMESLVASLRKRYEQLNAPAIGAAATGSAAPPTDDNGNINGTSNGTSASGDWMELAPFVQLLHSKTALILDCRGRDEFAESRIRPEYGLCLNVPAEIVCFGQSAGRIQSQLSREGKELWAMRSIKDHVVLMDWNSGSAGGLSDKLRALKSSLSEWDPDASYRNPLLALQGGYEQLLYAYPTYTTNAHYRPASRSAPAIDQRAAVDAIEYPNMNDIQMKDQIRPSTDVEPSPFDGRSSEAPTVDRSTKMSPLQQFEAESRRADNKRSKCLDAARDLLTVLQNSTETPDPDVLNEMKYKLMELDDFEREINSNIDIWAPQIADKSSNGPLATELRKRHEHETERKRLDRSIADAQMRLQMQRQRRKSSVDIPAIPTPPRVVTPPSLASTTVRVVPQMPAKPVSLVPKFDRSVKPSVAVAQAHQWPDIVRHFNAEPGGEGHGLTGLKNLGNTCYMNSIMQCLSNTARLRDYFIGETGYRRQCAGQPKGRLLLADELAAVLRELWLQKHRHVSSTDLRRVIGQVKQMFGGSEQQDSHEFLTILLDWLHEELPAAATNGATKPAVPMHGAADEAWQNFVRVKDSLVIRLFYGQIMSMIKCAVCGIESSTYESFSNLSLQLPEHGRRCKITECLQLFFYGEDISDWNCPRCKCKRKAIKKLNITRLPPVLVIHLKRFHVDLASASMTTYKKNTSYVHFPLDGLNMTEFLAPSAVNRMRDSAVYDLYGVSNHFGEMNHGHYTAFCKSDHYKKWYKFDDQNVTRMNPNDVPTSAAYILFYGTASQLQR